MAGKACHVVGCATQVGLTQALAMHAISGRPLHKPFLLAGVAGLGLMALGVVVLMLLSGVLGRALISFGTAVMGFSLLVGNVFALTKGAIISLGPLETLYAREHPVLFIVWLLLSPLASLVAAIAGFGGLADWLHG